MQRWDTYGGGNGMPMEEAIGCGNEVPIEAETVDL